MYRILPRHIKPQLASQRSVDMLSADPKLTVITHDGRYQLDRFRATKPGKPAAFQWKESGTNRAVSAMVSGPDQALRFALMRGWSVWVGTHDEAKSLIQQWEHVRTVRSRRLSTSI